MLSSSFTEFGQEHFGRTSFAKALQKDGFVVELTNYGYFDIMRFLVPWQLFASRGR